MTIEINIPRDRSIEFCRRWKVRELAIFGSALGYDFRSDSDVDVLVVFSDEAMWTLFDHMMVEEELCEILGRKVDLVEKRAIRNPLLKDHIRRYHEVIYAA